MMQGLTEQEVQKLRELITRQDVEAQKYRTYAQQCQDPQLRDHFSQVAQQADQRRQTLLNHLR